ncbi:MAG: S46 family peptidase [Bacteroidales bacterium]|nr:S46 family peptidase [Bacteroidales bacterium]MBN2756858.1 S46 family peptidase [Bacteroidales bacterium]
MKKILSLFLVFAFIFNFQAKADEGMWILTLLNKNYAEMKKQGFKLTPEDIYSLNNASIKDAIAIFGRGCTSEIVSDKGLLLTNHHCGYSAIQSQSSVEHNYLRDGFWAKNFNEELPIPGLAVRFFVRIEDVTEQINKKLKDKMSFEQRQEVIEKISKEIEENAKKGNNYITEVKSFFNDNNFYLVLYEKYSDVRLVGTPPESIGKFGHDTDNWVWPRHTGDFSVFRVYMSPDGKAAEYSEKNVPLKPKYVLPVSIKGVKKDDFTMVIGFPGSTNRYMTSYEIENLIDVTNTNRIKIRGIRQDIMLEDMKADEKIRIQYSSKFAGSSNYWKNSIGMNNGLRKLNVYAKKQETENKFRKWYAADDKLKSKYGNALTLIETANKGIKEYQSAAQYISETMLRGIEIFGFANRVSNMLDKPNEIKEYAKGFYKDYSKPTDKKIALAMLKLFDEDVDVNYHPAFLSSEVNNIRKGNFEAYVDDLYSKSIFANESEFFKFMETYDKEKIQKDPAYTATMSVLETSKSLKEKAKKFNADLETGRRLFLAGLMEMEKDKNFYPDANFTMRLSFGKVGDYKPKDAVTYDYFTTLKGVMEKEIPGDFEFDVSPKLKELYNKKDYGRYGQNGKMMVCFTSNDDITGGNSGSPIMNGNGELIGLAFDGNWEAMSGDIAFEPELQKCINVDIRYVLFIMDKFGGAKHLVDEMKIME